MRKILAAAVPIFAFFPVIAFSEINEILLISDRPEYFGESLRVGDALFGRKDLTGIERSVIVSSENAKIIDEPARYPLGDERNLELFDAEDKGNTAVIVVMDRAVSMAMNIDGKKNSFVCQAVLDFSACGIISISKEKKKLTFVNTTLKHTETGEGLTLNGVVEFRLSELDL